MNLIKFSIFFLLTLVFLGGIAYYLFVSEGMILILGIMPLLMVMLGLVTLVRIVKLLFSQKAGLVINETGIADNIAITKLGIIKWEEIKSVRVIKQSFQNFILLDLKDNNKHLANKVGIQKNQIKSSITKYGTPSAINANNLKIDLRELVSIINKKTENRT